MSNRVLQCLQSAGADIQRGGFGFNHDLLACEWVPACTSLRRGFLYRAYFYAQRRHYEFASAAFDQMTARHISQRINYRAYVLLRYACRGGYSCIDLGLSLLWFDRFIAHLRCSHWGLPFAMDYLA